MDRLVLLLLAAAACSSKKPETGHERGPCFENKTCMEGLLCMSDVCVRPPGAGGAELPSTDLSVKAYEAKSKTTEGREHLKKLVDSAKTYYMEGDGTFPPPSAGATPPLGTCCKDGGKCNPIADYWSTVTWRALDFAMDDPHYFSYELRTDAADGSFTALAYGDLDCDGTFSTFSIAGSGSGGGEVSMSQMAIENELE